ncbi:general secretion pathway protein G [alpha proteobacterium U9-1i]|nr:general secretion pathway protein G [alpha proteobacterium U9-1i]
MQRRVLAFTLTEMLVVLVIVGLLAAIVGPRLFSRVDDAKVRTARLQMTSLQTAIDLFRIDLGRLPTEDEGLRVLVEAPAGELGWLGPYLARGVLPTDPWGGDYNYTLDQSGYALSSFGADQSEGGDGAASDIEFASASQRAPSNGVEGELTASASEQEARP